jgi:hypothetical protein
MSFLLFAVAISSQPLWKDLYPGMTKDEVKLLYPTGKTALTKTCEAKVIPQYRKGELEAVWLRFGDLMAAGKKEWNAALECQAIVKSSIVEKYGEPAECEVIEKRNPMFKDLITYGDQCTFQKGQLKVTFYVERERPFTVITHEQLESPAEVKPDAADNL